MSRDIKAIILGLTLVLLGLGYGLFLGSLETRHLQNLAEIKLRASGELATSLAWRNSELIKTNIKLHQENFSLREQSYRVWDGKYKVSDLLGRELNTCLGGRILHTPYKLGMF